MKNRTKIILRKFELVLILLHRGIPKNPTNIEVNKFSPIWKFNPCAKKFIIKINRPPSIEFKINLNINFNGMINNLPMINIKQIQAINVSVAVKFILYLRY